MYVTENDITQIYNDKGDWVATVRPWLEGWILDDHKEKKARYFPVHSDAIYNAPC